jgi:hypothetical protein
MAKKRSSACIRCDGEGSLSKIGDYYFCKTCLAESHRHIYGTPASDAPVMVPAIEAEIPVKA